MENVTIGVSTITISLNQKLRNDALEITLREGRWREVEQLAKEMGSTLPTETITLIINLEVTLQYNLLLKTHLYHVLKKVLEKEEGEDELWLYEGQKEGSRLSTKSQSS